MVCASNPRPLEKALAAVGEALAVVQAKVADGSQGLFFVVVALTLRGSGGRLRDMTGIIYGLKDPRTPWRIRYVGSTIDVMQRLHGHILVLEQGRGQSRVMREWFRALKKASLVPQFGSARRRYPCGATFEP